MIDDSVASWPVAAVAVLLGILLYQHQWHLRYQVRMWLENCLQSIPTLQVPFPPIPTAKEGLPSVSFPALVDSLRPNMIQCWNPSTGEYLGQVPALTPAQVDEACAKAAAAQKSWKLTTFAERRRVLRTLQKFIVAHISELCTASGIDSGKPPVDAVLGEILTTCEKIAALLRHGEAWLQPELRPTSLLTIHKRAAVEYVPLGVVVAIAPWNYPFHNAMNHVLSGIFAGNGVVAKSSEHTSWSAHYYFAPMVRAALAACGHDPDLCQFVTGFAPAGQALCINPRVDKIVFTGSPEVGRRVMAAASEFLKPVILELGGKDALVVLDDAHLDAVVPWVMRGCFQNCGQNCVGIERVLVYEGLYDEFVDRVQSKVAALRPGPVTGGGGAACPTPSTKTPPPPVEVDCGALVMREQLAKIQALVDDAVVHGAKVLCGGTLANKAVGQFYPPTLLVGVTPAMKIFHTEVFGPVMSVIKVPGNSDAACLELANGTSFGLGASVYTSNPTRGLALGRQIRSGMLCVNDFGSNYLVQSLPFGGVGESGFGRFAGVEGLRALCLERSILTDRIPGVKTSIPPVLEYPIRANSYPFAASLIRFFYSDGFWGKLQGIIGLIKHGK